ncbi:Serine-rich adhesin for platelets [Quillaja saponaria]|uniref:Serine-rich adhesin for platelets n=1 Tax=Quillaja saponaria TaxID=32244 RepID=A0AAD7LFZ3_QUISA|nr:Serine-rich adhesin for platelets [Quillaja saponaria]KAJ7957077.1 Serine-rich adhesin for platelets [Quillaja saponaria]
MELEEAHDDLSALRLLYGLLHDDSLELKYAKSKDLVDRARVLLKCMLDAAAERVLETHLKFTTTQTSMSNTSQSEEPIPSLWIKPPGLSLSITQNPGIDSEFHSISQKNEHSLLKLLPPKTVSELPTSSICKNKEINRKKQCPMCQRSMKQQNSLKETNASATMPDKYTCLDQEHNNVSLLDDLGGHAKELSKVLEDKAREPVNTNEGPSQNKINGNQRVQSTVSSLEPQDKESDLSKEVADAIKRIEYHILNLQLCSGIEDSTKSSAGHHGMAKIASSLSSVLQTKDGIVTRSPQGFGKPGLNGNGLLRHQASQLTSKCESLNSTFQPHNPILVRKYSLSQAAKQNDRLPTSNRPVKRVDIKKGGDSSSTKLVAGGKDIQSKSKCQTPRQNVKAMVQRVESLTQSACRKDHLASQDSECVHGLRVPSSQDDLMLRTSMWEGLTTLDTLITSPTAQKENKRKVMRHELSRAPKPVESKASFFTRSDKRLSRQMIMRPTLLDHKSSDIKVSPGHYKDWKVREKRGTHVMTPLEMQNELLPRLHESEKSSSSSSRLSSSWTTDVSSGKSIDTEEYSSPIRSPSHQYMSHESSSYESSPEENSSCSSYYFNDESPPSRVSHARTYRSGHQQDSEKAIGRLRRLKNKLGLIFHHHHHRDHNGRHDSDHSRLDHKHSLWGHLQKIVHGKKKHMRDIEKPRKSTVTGMPQRNQVGQFHGLVQGLLRHIRHSKKSKPSKVGGLRGSGKVQRGRGKKLHWWKMLQRQGLAKLPTRKPVKVGFASKRPQLKMG